MSVFKDERVLLILDLANNHNGSVAHGKKIIESAYSALAGLNFRMAIKFQYRDLDTFIHPTFKGNHEIKYIKRFEETRLTDEQFIELKDFATGLGFISACTPFDELSADKVKSHNFDLLKIASASFTDWPLLEKISTLGMPTIASTAGASVNELDRVANFLSKRLQEFALMHCVAAYPTEDHDLSLNRITYLRNRYSDIPIGYSTHEHPSNYLAGPIALAKGATILERHIGLDESNQKKNGYSSNQEELQIWGRELSRALEMLGPESNFKSLPSEQEALQGLRRGVYAREHIKSGEIIDLTKVFLSIPLEPDQLSANDLSNALTYTATGEIPHGSKVLKSSQYLTTNQGTVQEISDRAKALFEDSAARLPKRVDLEISHHYGIEKFDDFGTVIINFLNREYCKKLLGIFPGQTHPEHFHKQKEETFICISGSVDLWLDDKIQVMTPGDIVTIPRLVKHKFSSTTGAVIEEISSKHFVDDSFYTDPKIQNNALRKTKVSIWRGNTL